MRRGIAYLLAGILLWLVCQLSQVFLYKLPILFGVVGYVMFGAGWLISRHGVQWKAPTLVRSWLVGILGMALMLSGLGVVLGRFLEGTRGNFFSWGLIASLGVVVAAIMIVGVWLVAFPKYYESVAYWVSATIFIIMGAVSSGYVVWAFGMWPRAPRTAAEFSSLWVFLLAFVVFCWFHRGLSSPDDAAYSKNFDILRGVSGVLIGRDMAWGKNGK